MIRLRLDKGSYTVEIEGETPAEVIQNAELFSDIPGACPECGAELHFTYRKPQGYDYYGLACNGPVVHETTFGEKREGGTLYYKRTWQEAPGRQRDDEDAGSPPPPARSRESEPPRQTSRLPASSGTRGGERSAAPQRTREPAPKTAAVPPREDPPAWKEGAAQEPASGHFCASPHCGAGITDGQAAISSRAFGKPLCAKCQVVAREQLAEEPVRKPAAATVEQRNALLAIIGEGKRAGWLPQKQAAEYLRFAQDKDLHYGAAEDALGTLKQRQAQVGRIG